MDPYFKATTNHGTYPVVNISWKPDGSILQVEVLKDTGKEYLRQGEYKLIQSQKKEEKTKVILITPGIYIQIKYNSPDWTYTFIIYRGTHEHIKEEIWDSKVTATALSHFMEEGLNPMDAFVEWSYIYLAFDIPVDNLTWGDLLEGLKPS